MIKLLPLLLVFALGCEGRPIPDGGKTVSVPADTSYESILAWEAAKVLASVITPTPAPDNDTLKPGDDCPGCDGGYIFGDGSVKEKCWKCNGDGVANEGDPILSTTSPVEEGISILVEANAAKDERIENLEITVQTLRTELEDLKAYLEEVRCKCNETPDETPVKPKKEELPPVNPDGSSNGVIYGVTTEDVIEYSIVYQGRTYIWDEEKLYFRCPEMNYMINPASDDVASISYVQICHGSYCTQMPVMRTVKKVEVPSGPVTTPKPEDGASGN